MEGEVNSVRNDKKRVNGDDDDDAKPVGDISRVSMDGPHKYYHFHAFEFDGHSFQINDSVLVTPEEGKIKPTVLIIKEIFQTEDGELMIKGQRLYRPEDCTIKGSERELFYTTKIVKVPANAVMHKCVIHFVPNNNPTLDPKVQHGFFVKKTYDFERNELRDLTQQECRGLLQQPKSMDRLSQIRARLDALHPTEVVWCPFGRFEDRDATFNISTYRGLISYRDVVEPYMPDRCVRQFGYVQPIPDSILTPPRCKRSPRPNSYLVGWSTHTAQMLWTARNMQRFPIGDIPRATRLGTTATDYMAWFTRHSHPLVVAATPELAREYGTETGYQWADQFYDWGVRFMQEPQMDEISKAYPVMSGHARSMKWLTEQYSRLGGTSQPPPRPPADL